MNIFVANDAGNDSIKAVLDDKHFTMPSVVALLGSRDITEPITFDDKKQEQEHMSHFLEHMDASISSSSIQEQHRFLVGKAAVDSQLQLTSFDFNDYSGKSEVDLTLLLTLSMIAGFRVERAYQNGEDLTNPLQASVVMTTALPITEGKQPGVVDAYKQRYINHSHVVTFHNFINPITVSIKFKQVEVGLEGEMAQLAISNSKNLNKDLGQAIFSSFKKTYPNLANDITLSDIINARCVLGIDIGGKTTDFALVVNGQVNAKASLSLIRGYDNVLQDSIDDLQSNEKRHFSFESIAQLQDYLKHPNPFAKEGRKDVLTTIEDHSEPFADQIIQATSKILRKAGLCIWWRFYFNG